MENICLNCNKSFLKRKDSKGLYCSRECFRHFKNRKITKHCRFCKKEFTVNLHQESRIYCGKECYHAGDKKTFMIGEVEYKKCNKCQETKILSEFYTSPSRRTRGHLHPHCRMCEKAAHNKYIASEKGLCFLDKQSRKPSTRYYKLCRVAKDKNRIVDLTFEQYKELILQNCHYCDRALNEKGYGLDRKNNEKIYKSETVVPCCRDCNFTFGDRYNYEEKILLSSAIKIVWQRRNGDLL